MLKRIFLLSLLLVSWISLVPTDANAYGTQLIYGKYFGVLQMDGRTEKIAVSLDAFIVQFNNPTTYPALNVIVRTNLGGFQGREYVAYNFYAPTFNYEQGILELNDADKNLSATLSVSSSETESILEGPVVFRMSNSKGRMKLVMKTDDTQPDVIAPLASLLSGEYEGRCGKDSASLQIETGHELAAVNNGNALNEFAITGRLGFSNAPNCSKSKLNKYCSQAPFGSGTYSPFSGQLTMQGPLGTITCGKNSDSLTCDLLLYSRKNSCELKKKFEPFSQPIQAPKTSFIGVPVDSKKALSDPLPPENAALLKDLNGDFYGFLHHENRDLYQPLEMNVVASTSTENPHVQNQVMINPTLFLRLGKSWDTPTVLSIFFPQRVFWMNPGFAFQDASSDYIAVISSWRKGYVSGILYSRSYGRIGSFEMLKGSKPPAFEHMNSMESPFKNFRGPIDLDSIKNLRTISIEIPNQIPASGQSGIPVLGRFSSPGVMSMFDAGSIDLNTGSVNLLIRNSKGDRLVTGEITKQGSMSLLWPVGPALGAPMVDYKAFSYLPTSGK